MLVTATLQKIQILVILDLVTVIILFQMTDKHVIQLLENIILREVLHELGLIVKQIFNLGSIHIIHVIPDNRPVIILQVVRLFLSLKIPVHNITIRLPLVFQLSQKLNCRLGVRRVRLELLHQIIQCIHLLLVSLHSNKIE